MRRFTLALLALVAGFVPSSAFADHTPRHDTRPNPNCAWDSRRSVDADGDGEPDHFTAGLSHDTSFPRQLVVVLRDRGVPIDQIPPFFGGHEGRDQVTLYMQGDHRMFGANPARQPNGEPEQLHNGAIYAKVDYDDVERGRIPIADVRFGIYEANHLVMACVSTAETPDRWKIVACLNGMAIYPQNYPSCPQG